MWGGGDRDVSVCQYERYEVKDRREYVCVRGG